MTERTAKEVIDEAIRENKLAEWMLYFFAALFVIVGLSILIIGIIRLEPVTGVLGGLALYLFWPLMTAARKIRKENIAIRLLEVPLNRADTAKQASDTLSDYLLKSMGANKKMLNFPTFLKPRHSLKSVAQKIMTGLTDASIYFPEKNHRSVDRNIFFENKNTPDNTRHELGETLSQREMDIYRLLEGGKSTTEICDILFLSHTTVIGYKHRLFKKLNIT